MKKIIEGESEATSQLGGGKLLNEVICAYESPLLSPVPTIVLERAWLPGEGSNLR